MLMGKLYRFNEEQFVANVNYRLLREAATKLSGELIPVECERLSEGGDYIVELEDSRKIKCRLRKNVNSGVSGLPPRFVYRFSGRTTLA